MKGIPAPKKRKTAAAPAAPAKDDIAGVILPGEDTDSTLAMTSDAR